MRPPSDWTLWIAIPYNKYGKTLAALNDSKAARTAYEKAISLDPACWQANYGYGVLLLSFKEYPEARQAFEKVKALNPQLANACSAKLLEAGDFQGACYFAQEALTFDPTNAEAAYNIGVFSLDAKISPRGFATHLKKRLSLPHAFALAYTGYRYIDPYGSQ